MNSKKTAVCKSGRETSKEIKPANIWLVGFQLHNCKKINFSCWSPPVCGICYSSLSELIHWGFIPGENKQRLSPWPAHENHPDVLQHAWAFSPELISRQNSTLQECWSSPQGPYYSGFQFTSFPWCDPVPQPPPTLFCHLSPLFTFLSPVPLIPICGWILYLIIKIHFKW